LYLTPNQQKVCDESQVATSYFLLALTMPNAVPFRGAFFAFIIDWLTNVRSHSNKTLKEGVGGQSG